MSNPFLIETEKPLVVLMGTRCGYLQLAPSRLITTYSELPDELFLAAKAWAGLLESHGARRVYWVTLSEMVRHLHIHLYPRWTDAEEQGLALFEQRDTEPQPVWTEEVLELMRRWTLQYQVEMIEPR